MLGGIVRHGAGSDRAVPAAAAATEGADMSILVIDVGTSGVRAAIVRPDASVHHERAPGDPARLARCPAWSSSTPPRYGRRGPRLRRERRRCADGRPGRRRRHQPTSGPRPSCGTAPPASPSRPALGWQDLRTVGDCLVLNGRGLPPRPQPVGHQGVATCSTPVDPDRTRDLCFGTVDSWLVWHLTEGAHHVTDLTQRGDLRACCDRRRPTSWDHALLERLRIPASMLPDASSTPPG